MRKFALFTLIVIAAQMYGQKVLRDLREITVVGRQGRSG